MKKNYELQAKRNKVKGEVGYGIMWLFVAALVEGIGYVNGFKVIYSHLVAGLSVVTAIYKFSESISLARKIL